MRRLLVEGWRFIPHSYALVAQSHCLCLLQEQEVELRFVNLPYYFAVSMVTPSRWSALGYERFGLPRVKRR